MCRALTAVLALPILACTPRLPAGEDPCRAQVKVTVTEVTDGDTIHVEIQEGEGAGTEEDVRLLGIDTPEVDHFDTARSQCWAVLAWNRTIELLSGKEAWLTFDSACTDLHGRTLAWVYDADSTFVNGDLVEGGFARTCPWSPPGAFDADLAALEQSAQAAGAGLWGGCDDPASLGECDN
jgi:micrococcal nuclease